MSAGSGRRRRVGRADPGGAREGGLQTTATDAGRVTFGSEQQLQKWQFGAHCPPDASDGQSSSHAESPQIAASPLTSNVSSARNRTRTARRTAPSISQDPGHRLPPPGVDRLATTA